MTLGRQTRRLSLTSINANIRREEIGVGIDGHCKTWQIEIIISETLISSGHGIKKIGFFIGNAGKSQGQSPRYLGDNNLIRGGGGWHFWSGQIYFHHVLGRKIYFRVNRGQNIFIFNSNKFVKKQKKKGWGLVRGFSRGDRTWFSMFCITICRLLARNIAI